MAEPPVYRIFLDGEQLCETNWAPLAQAAWNQAGRHRDAAQHGWRARLEKNGHVLADLRPHMGRGLPWPDSDTFECGLPDVLKALLLLLRHDGWDAKELAEAMTAFGLPTSRSRIDAFRGTTPGKRTELTPADLVVMIHTVLSEYKRE
ncbi:hypothetical protein [Pseudomonas aeruginosa]|uniref:hypothetical protein n=1 Tax=Pseudomonas aeruginosa TaxID=287 RepID=UPI000F7F845D|nr:hypothetical protein [Pseudomonas aeruginosa]RTB44141.1 hypothetical protein EJ655_08365 [Pseudomonas aeruginosa]